MKFFAGIFHWVQTLKLGGVKFHHDIEWWLHSCQGSINCFQRTKWNTRDNFLSNRLRIVSELFDLQRTWWFCLFSCEERDYKLLKYDQVPETSTLFLSEIHITFRTFFSLYHGIFPLGVESKRDFISWTNFIISTLQQYCCTKWFNFSRSTICSIFNFTQLMAPVLWISL